MHRPPLAKVKLCAVLAVAITLSWSIVPPADARVNPLVVIERQIRKANVLIVLDTSGSMTGVPGGAFVQSGMASSECGVDCDNGVNCRSVQRNCSSWKRPCVEDADCRHGYCSKDDASCTSTANCLQDPGTCSFTGDSCTAASPCPIQTATCSATGVLCSSKAPCAAQYRCKYGNKVSCSNPKNNCSNTYACSNNLAKICTKASDCPGGSCTWHTDNKCSAIANTCPAPDNTCDLPPANTCQLPASSYDTCVVTSTGTPVPIRMCKGSQLVCNKDADCGTDDACGPATSRTVIAKRAISKLVMGNYSLVNFGLMTFYQDDYYPYFPISSGTSSETITVFETEEQLRRAGCYSWKPQTRTGGPTGSCTISGRQMTLRLISNSRYRTRGGRNQWNRYDVNFCGDSCDLPDHQGMGSYVGSYYQYDRLTQTQTSQTPLIQSTYDGQEITVNGIKYSYFKPKTDYYYTNAPLSSIPVEFGSCGTSCSATCGGRWDAQLAPFLDTSDLPSKALDAAKAITARMDYASNGGLMTYWGTPTGCTLENSGTSATPFASAYHYMDAVKKGYSSSNPSLQVPADPVTCRSNFILLVTDGAASGPGDVGCANSNCADNNPETAGCTCRSVLAAYHLKQKLGVTVFVVGFSGDVSAGQPAVANNNVAKAGGSGSAYKATSEDELNRALQMAIYDAIKGNYSSSAGSTSAGTQQAVTVVEGRYALDSRMEFPSWRGHLFAYDVSGTQPVQSWDASTALTPPEGNSTWADWKYRRVYTWNGSSMVKIQVNALTGAVTNKDELAALGMGASPSEAELVARWALGDPAMGNPAVLGAIVNSTPIDVASPGDIPLPGGHAFFLRQQNRPHLVYVGSSDQMLHAFFLEDTTVGTTTYEAGTEAFAFIPPDLLPNLRKLFSQGGQDLNPYKHVFGLADSPKAKSLCVSGCADDATAVWKTLLLMPEGYGGTNTFMLDITNPFGTNGLNDPPIGVQWHTGYGASADSYARVLGNTISLPAYFFNKTSAMNDYRVIFSSGYAVTEGSSDQGRTLVTASAINGSLLTTGSVAAGATCTTQEYTALTDVATARDFAKGQNDKLIAGYFGDTAGQLWRYTLSGGLTKAHEFTCSHPLHFSPTVVQLDRDNPYSSHAHEIYLVQVTNSNLDLDTVDLPASQLIIAKEVATADEQGNLTKVEKATNWGTNNSGKIVLTAGTNQICARTHETGGSIVCDEVLPAKARPTSTPLGLLKADGNGFQVVSMWYASPSDVCEVGRTFLTIHQMANDQVSQRLGYEVKSTNPATSPVIIGGRVYVFGGTTTFDDVTPFMRDSIIPGRAIEPSPIQGQFTRLNWMEVVD